MREIKRCNFEMELVGMDACVRVLSLGLQIQCTHVMCVLCGPQLVDVWLEIGLLGIGLGVRAGMRVCGYGFATSRPAPLDLAGLTFCQTLPI